MTEESFPDLMRKCIERFSLLEHVESPIATESDRKAVLDISEEEARFKIWSGNIGARSTGRRSLQYRLRDASHLQKQVRSLLDDLFDLLGDAYAIFIGEKVPWDHADDDEATLSSLGSDSMPESDDVPATEMSQIAQNVTDIIDCLSRLSVAIRNPASHDRFATFVSIDVSHYEPLDIQHVKSKFSEVEPFLAIRLGRAISRRRNYFKYRESHRLKLFQGPSSLKKSDAESRAAKSLHQQEKVADDNLDVVDEDGSSDSDTTQSSGASSYAGDDKLHLPPLPRQAQNGPFECPFCYMMIKATSPLSWKQHLLADLRPYVCLSIECTTSEVDFCRRREWVSHEIQNHWKTYFCPCSCGMDFSTKSQCRDHVSKSHLGAFPEEQVNSMIDVTSKPINIGNGISCPLCKQSLDSVKEYQHHTGRHQEELSLFALPPIDASSLVDEGAKDETVSKPPTSSAAGDGIGSLLDTWLEDTQLVDVWAAQGLQTDNSKWSRKQ